MKSLGIHLLTAYPPSNPNRDENGQPKSAMVAGVLRQRISSQCIKRAWRLSDLMKAVQAGVATRTRGMGGQLYESLIAGGVDDANATAWAAAIALQFGEPGKEKSKGKSKSKGKDKDGLRHAAMVVLGHEELAAIHALTNVLVAERRAPTVAELAGLPRKTTSLDVALFGRMRAGAPDLSKDAAVYVSHPLTTGKAAMDSDFWTAVDDLSSDGDVGAGGMGDVEFGSGTYYTYVEINTSALAANLDGDETVARAAVAALIEAMAVTAPSGHKTSFGNAVRASYVRVEVGQPSGNLFCKAYEKPVQLTAEAVTTLQAAAAYEARTYGLQQAVFEFPGATGTLKDLIAAVVDAV